MFPCLTQPLSFHWSIALVYSNNSIIYSAPISNLIQWLLQIVDYMKYEIWFTFLLNMFKNISHNHHFFAFFSEVLHTCMTHLQDPFSNICWCILSLWVNITPHLSNLSTSVSNTLRCWWLLNNTLRLAMFCFHFCTHKLTPPMEVHQFLCMKYQCCVIAISFHHHVQWLIWYKILSSCVTFWMAL